MTAPGGYEALRERAAWLDVSSRGKILVMGEDRARLLHAMTTNNVQELTPGEWCYAYFLSAQGRILADVNILCQADALLLDTEPESVKKIFDHLEQFIIADDVTLEDQTGVLATIAVEGPEASALMDAFAPVFPISLTGAGGFLIIAPMADKAAIEQKLDAAGVTAATPEAFRIVRIEHGKPRHGEDLTERFLSQEANQAHALSFTKGCYLGQEIVERVRSRGQVHRLLMPLRIESTEIPAPGTKVMEGTVSMAEITSAAFSPALGQVVALAYVRTEKARPGAEMRLGDAVVRVV